LQTARQTADDNSRRFVRYEETAAMALEDLLERLRRQPFQPFRVRLRDGRSHDICHRHVSLVLRSCLLIDRAESGEPDRIVTIAAEDVESVEPVR
jgi:hypothetical protein